MERIEKTIEVDCPVRAVYNQWTQFQDFPQFMAGVKEVRQLDDTHLHWRAEVWGKDEEWDAVITEQTPDDRISWRSIGGAANAGTVRFEPLGADRTRVRLVMSYEPEGLLENVGSAIGRLRTRSRRASKILSGSSSPARGKPGLGAAKCTTSKAKSRSQRARLQMMRVVPDDKIEHAILWSSSFYEGAERPSGTRPLSGRVNLRERVERRGSVRQ